MINTLAFLAFFQLVTPNHATVAYPTLGYTLSGGQLIRLNGLPGACYSTPDPNTSAFLQLRTASAAKAALLSVGGDAPTLVYRGTLNDTNVTLAETPVLTAISPSGAYFAALSSSHLWLYRRSGTAALATLDVASLPAQAPDITTLLVGDNGDLILNTAAGFWYSPTPTAGPASFSLVMTFWRFTPHDHLLIGYDPAGGRVIALHPTAAFAVEPLLTSHDVPSPVTGLEFGADGLSIWVSQQGGAVVSYNLPDGSATSYSLPAGSLAGVAAPGVFLWSGPDQETVILDTTRGTPTVLAIPSVGAQDSQ